MSRPPPYKHPPLNADGDTTPSLNNMRISLMNELTGIKVYQSSPVWLLDKEIATVDLSDTDNVSIHDGKFGKALRIDEENGVTLFVPFKRGTAINEVGTYTIGLFKAERDADFDDVHIKAGAVKYMAY